MSAVFEPRQGPRCFHELETLFGNGFTLSVSLSCFISFSHLTNILLFQKASFQSFGNTKKNSPAPSKNNNNNNKTKHHNMPTTCELPSNNDHVEGVYRCRLLKFKHCTCTCIQKSYPLDRSCFWIRSLSDPGKTCSIQHCYMVQPETQTIPSS